MSDTSRFAVDDTRVAGFGVAGLLAFGLDTYRTYVENRVMNAVRAAGFAAWFWAITGSMLVVWGLSTAVTGRWRSLTPRRAAPAPVLVFGAHAAVVLRMNAWTGADRGPETLLIDFFTWTFAWEQLRGGVGAAAALFGVAAVAAFRGRWDWMLGALGGVVLLGLALGSVTDNLAAEVVELLILSATMGVGAAIVGYYAAAAPLPSDDPPEAASTDRQSTAE